MGFLTVMIISYILFMLKLSNIFHNTCFWICLYRALWNFLCDQNVSFHFSKLGHCYDYFPINDSMPLVSMFEDLYMYELVIMVAGLCMDILWNFIHSIEGEFFFLFIWTENSEEIRKENLKLNFLLWLIQWIWMRGKPYIQVHDTTKLTDSVTALSL